MLFRTLTLGLLATIAAAQSTVLTFTRVPSPITDGESAVILYATNDTQSPVEIILRKGSPNQLQTIEVLTSTATGGQFIWHPSTSIPNGQDYALEIKQGTQVNYFGPFTIQGASASASVSSSSQGGNATMTTSGAASNGTSTTMHRNQTMSHPTMTHHGSPQFTMPSSTSAGATFQGTAAGAQPSSSPGAAAPNINAAGSSLALIFGAVAAMFYLQ